MIGTAEQYSMNKQYEYGMCRGTGRRTHTENRYPMTAMFRKYPDALRLNELADMLGVSTKLASRLVRDGTIPSVKIGREYRIAKSNAVKYRIPKSSLVSFLASDYAFRIHQKSKIHAAMVESWMGN